jgi:2-hydroxychromene-2-carboxylate isomerase
MPEGFPINTLTIMRALCAFTSLYKGKEEEGQKKLVKLLDVLLPELWVNHEKVYEKDVFGEVFEEVLGKKESETGE